jgi:23S rRNA (adenine1618-N6)-methyltransferase
MTNSKAKLHPRNIHKELYDFEKLCKLYPDLKKFVKQTPFGKLSIDYANPKAVKALNGALLKYFYHIDWDIPENFLCPPIPGRVDYIHYVADILAEFNQGKIPRGEKITVLDIGTGANCIYPLLGYAIYQWNFIASDVNSLALKSAEANIKKNHFENHIDLRHQKDPSKIFEGILTQSDPLIDITMCNPPFHSSKKEAQNAAYRKLKNLGIKTKNLNFGGQNLELFCDGGELMFIKQMIKESKYINCRCFTTLVSKADHLKAIYETLALENAKNIKTIDMGQGQKISRLVSWSF